MKHVSQIMAIPTPSQPVAKVADLPPEIKKATAKVINDLFDELRSIFPAWKQAWTTNELFQKAKASWTEGLLAEGLTDWALIERGLARCRAQSKDFIPSVGKFIEMCYPTASEMSMPEEDRAYWEACRNSHPAMMGHETWTHNGVYHAAIQCSRHSLMNLPADVSRLKFKEAYRTVVRRVARGELLPEPPLALPADVKRKGDPEKAKDALSKMRAAIGGAA